MKKIIGIFSLGVLLFGLSAVGHVAYLYTHREFGPKDFYHPFILKQKRAVLPGDDVKRQAMEILSQSFTYLNHGGQMTVYESQDRKYVLKFFNPRSVIKKSWFHQFSKLRRFNSLKWITNTYFRKKERMKRFFLRYEMAFRDLKEETGLVYVHLDPSTCLAQSVEVIDKEGSYHRLPLAAYPFVLQKKVELTMDYFNRLLKNGDVDGARKGVEQIYDLFLTRTQKGYTDRLQTLYKNYGFIEGRAVQLDIGRIRKNPSMNRVREMERIVSNITPSLAQPYPNLAPVLQECLNKTQSQ